MLQPNPGHVVAHSDMESYGVISVSLDSNETAKFKVPFLCRLDPEYVAPWPIKFEKFLNQIDLQLCMEGILIPKGCSFQVLFEKLSRAQSRPMKEYYEWYYERVSKGRFREAIPLNGMFRPAPQQDLTSLSYVDSVDTDTVYAHKDDTYPEDERLPFMMISLNNFRSLAKQVFSQARLFIKGEVLATAPDKYQTLTEWISFVLPYVHQRNDYYEALNPIEHPVCEAEEDFEHYIERVKVYLLRYSDIESLGKPEFLKSMVHRQFMWGLYPNHKSLLENLRNEINDLTVSQFTSLRELFMIERRVFRGGYEMRLVDAKSSKFTDRLGNHNRKKRRKRRKGDHGYSDASIVLRARKKNRQS